jgi:hypothetical protein
MKFVFSASPHGQSKNHKIGTLYGKIWGVHGLSRAEKM